MNPRFKFLRNLAWLTQIGLSVAAPLVLCVIGSVWLKNHCGIGGWIVVLGVLLGVGASVSSLWASLKGLKREADREDKHPPRSYNDHE